MHLDLKPANVLITFEGVLKIADFGMATKWPAEFAIDREGDRGYMGPEVLVGEYDKPADIFSLGLTMVETAGNILLPNGGPYWQRLREGDLSDIPSLTWSSLDSSTLRDYIGNPLVSRDSFADTDCSDEGFQEAPMKASLQDKQKLRDCQEQKSNKSSSQGRSGELVEPPGFMIDSNDPDSLYHILRWMIHPDPRVRPAVDQILQSVGIVWVESRRRAGATVYEGSWGPADDVLLEDAEMIDV